MIDGLKTMQYKFTKDERLCNKQIIDKLFTEGKSVFCYPFRFVFIYTEETDYKYPVKVVFSVPKRNFKNAVDRNLIRRRIREVYRNIKPDFYEIIRRRQKNLALMIIFTGKEIVNFDSINNYLKKGMGKLSSKID